MSTNTFMLLALCLYIINFTTRSSGSEMLQPGLVVRLSLAGLNCIAQEGGKILESQIKGSVDLISGFSKTIGESTVSFGNIRITDFVTTQTTVNIDPGNGIMWRLKSVRISLTGLWNYTHSPLNVPYKKNRGIFNISAEGLHLTIRVTLGIKSGERPDALLQNCSTSIEKLMVSYDEHNLSWARESMEIIFRKKISDSMCQMAGDIVTKSAAAELETLTLNQTVENEFTLDYRLVETPRLYDNFVQTAHSGEFRLTGKLFGPSFLPSELNLPKSTSSAVTFYVSEYVINTLTEAMFKLKRFVTGIRKNDLPLTNQSVLSTACNGTCFGTAFPQVSRQYPNISANLVIRATTRPVLSIRNDSANLKSELEMGFVIEPGYNRDAAAVTLSLVGTANVNASVVGDKLVGRLLSINLSVVNITGNVSSNDFLQTDSDNLYQLLNIIGNLVIVPALSEAAAIGFRLPTLDGVQFFNTKVTMIPCAFSVGADFAYNREAFKPTK